MSGLLLVGNTASPSGHYNEFMDWVVPSESGIVLSLSKTISSEEYQTLKTKTDLSVTKRDITEIDSGLTIALLILVHCIYFVYVY